MVAKLHERYRAGFHADLVGHFVKIFSERLGKPIDVIPDEVMEVLKAHDWPGNIRELQNFIERAVVFSPGPVLRPTLTELKQMTKQPTSFSASLLKSAGRATKRKFILRTSA
jgi:DNA-binding NtrC family response regulator